MFVGCQVVDSNSDRLSCLLHLGLSLMLQMVCFAVFFFNFCVVCWASFSYGSCIATRDHGARVSGHLRSRKPLNPPPPPRQTPQVGVLSMVSNFREPCPLSPTPTVCSNVQQFIIGLIAPKDHSCALLLLLACYGNTMCFHGTIRLGTRWLGS